MCGLAGVFDCKATADELESMGRDFTRRLRHRGPDSSRVVVLPEHSLALAHTRLSIIDLSDAGAQPMTSADGRFIITYNGEFYNHREIRTELGGKAGPFRGTSDTETMLAAITVWGLRATLERCRGMFALALFDTRTGTLSLARDRFGQKPLYYGQVGSKFVFTSNLDALGPLRSALSVDRRALHGYLQTGAMPRGMSIYQELKKLNPGVIVHYRLDGHVPKPAGSVRYWDFEAEIAKSIAEPFTGSFAEAIDELDRLLFEAVQMRMLSDVPVGSMLSGGVDSTLTSALMQRASATPIQTFTAAFAGHCLDESETASRVAAHLGASQSVLQIEPSDLLRLLPELSAMNGEPLADPSQIPTHLICRHARNSVTVCLAGDGGDEFFGGYSWQGRGARLVKSLALIPHTVRSSLAGLSTAFGGALGERYARRADNVARALAVNNPLDARLALTGAWKSGSVPLQPHGSVTIEDMTEPIDWPDLPEVEQQMLWLDAVSFLPDLVLTKADRASMWASLEARAPLLDHEVALFAWSLPTAWRLGPRSTNGEPTNKWILRRLLDRYVPRPLMDRPKQGFDVPIDHWLRHELREWAGDLLSPGRLQAAGYLDPVPIQQAWHSHQTGRDDHSARLWTVLMFESWLDHLVAGDTVPSSDG